MSHHSREVEVCEVELLNVPLTVLFPPHHLRPAKAGEDQEPPYDEKLSISVWLKYKTPDDQIDHNWDWVSLLGWLETQDRREFAEDGTLERLRNLITRRALKEPFEQGLDVQEIQVDIMRTTEGIHGLHASQSATLVAHELTARVEAAVITHTIQHPSPEHWGFFDETPTSRQFTPFAQRAPAVLEANLGG